MFKFNLNNCRSISDKKVGTVCSIFIGYLVLSLLYNIFEIHFNSLYSEVTLITKLKLNIYQILITSVNIFIMYHMCRNCRGLLGFILVILFGIISYCLTLYLFPGLLHGLLKGLVKKENK